MLKKRIIPAMDIENGSVVKCVRFENPRFIGDPVSLGVQYANDGADELIYLDISATRENRNAMLGWIEDAARALYIPFCVVGGIRSLEDIRDILRAGADKVGLNSAAVQRPQLIAEAAQEFGSQCIVVAVDTKCEKNGWQVYTHSGKQPTGLDALAWVREAERLGAGEIVHTSIDADGTRSGYDLAFLSLANAALRIPVIASGGAGSLAHVYDAFNEVDADGALVASIVHDGDYSIQQIKQYLAERGIPVRLPRQAT